jgi:hypothetical protein
MQETVASPRVFNTLSTLHLLVFACIGATQAQVVIAPSPPGGFFQSCHCRTAQYGAERQTLRALTIHQRDL